VRSPHAHARIKKIDNTTSAALPGVIAVLTGAEMAADKVGPMAPFWAIQTSDGKPMAEPPRFALARGTVRYAGEAVAAVVAESRAQAQDAADVLTIDYEELPAVVDGRGAMEKNAPQLHDAAPGNICFRYARGEESAVRKVLAGATHVSSLDLANNRLIGAAIEPRAVLADGSAGKKLTLYCSTQVPHHIRRAITEQLGLPQTAVRLVAPDVGGGFGYKGKHYPEETIVAWASLKLRRPVKWVATRSESFLSDYQGRGHQTRCELAFDAEGHFLAIRVDTVANIGAYVSTFGAGIPSAIYSALLAGVYRTPAIYIQSTGVFTNTVPTDAYRGAGRPEACLVLERLADEAARTLGIDRAEIRRRNLVPLAAMPYKTPIGPTYDCGNFPKVLSRLLEIADYSVFAKRRALATSGKLRGFGIACFVESSGVAPSRMAASLGARVGFFEAAQVRVQSDGSVQALLGTHNHGQGHATTFAQIIASRLGVPMASVEIIEGDTDQVPYGSGTFGSRSIAVGGSALDRAAMKVIEKGKRIAAHLLEAAASDIAFTDGIFKIDGTDRRVTLREIARVAHNPTSYPAEDLGLQDSAVYDPPNFAWSNGAHACEVEVDCDTGEIRVQGYWSVDDIGTVINPMIVHGQIEGGIAQGLGQALREHCFYDSSGQLLSGSFMDYAVPRAKDMPGIVSELDESQPCTHNPLGAKGCGEAGSIGAPAAIVSAVLDALRPLGVKEIEMPLTPVRVWQAIKASLARS
jgi:carbon-monoxide dehydrogenase large subunit